MNENNQQQHTTTPTHSWGVITEVESGFNGDQQHPDDQAVDRFAAAMKDKLSKAREKGRTGWETCPPEDLSRMLREHIEKGDPRDVANFCMMLWNLGEGITAQQQEPCPEEPAGHIAGGVQPSTRQDRWVERWYGSLADKGWWICCGREHIAHLGTEVSSDEVRKIVDAHNRTSPPAQPAQQQESVAALQRVMARLADLLDEDQFAEIEGIVARSGVSPPAQRKPLPYNKDDMEGLDINQRLGFKLGWKSAEEAHGIKGDA